MPVIKSCRYCRQSNEVQFMICKFCRESHTKAQTKWCSSCQSIKGWSDFNGDRKSLFGLKAVCKICRSNYEINRKCSREPFLRAMLRNCANSTRTRNTNGRDMIFNWSYEEMCNKLDKLEDKCSKSGILMNFRPHCDWQCSPERIDNNVGYIDSNMTFVCLEFQLGGRLQSSTELVEFICGTECEPHPRLTEIISGQFLENPLFYHCLLGRHGCKDCQKIYSHHYGNTVKGKIHRLLQNAKIPPKNATEKVDIMISISILIIYYSFCKSKRDFAITQDVTCVSKLDSQIVCRLRDSM